MCQKPLGRTANLTAAPALQQRRFAVCTNYTRKNERSGRKRQGAEPASRPCPIVLKRLTLRCRPEHRGPLRDLALHEGSERLRGPVRRPRDDAAELEQALAHG